MVAALERESVGFQISRQAHTCCLADRFRGRELEFEFLHDGARDLVLNFENVLELAIIALGPQVRLIGNADELCGDSNASARFANATLQHVPDAKLLADVFKIQIAAKAEG